MMYLNLFLTFFKIGAFTFGGGYAMLPLIQEEVLRQKWLPLEDVINFIAVSESTPGPFAINMATYVGIETAGLLGAVCATLGVVLPSFIVIFIIASFFEKFKENKTVEGCMSGLKPAVIGLMSAAVISIGKTVFFPAAVSLDVFKTSQFYFCLIVAGIMSVFAFKKAHPILIIIISAVLGIAAGYILGF